MLLGAGVRPLGLQGACPNYVTIHYGGKFKMDTSKTGDVKNNLTKFLKLIRKMKIEADPNVEQ